MLVLRLIINIIFLEIILLLLFYYLRSIELYDVEIWTLRKVDQKCLKSFLNLVNLVLEKISWTNRVRNEVLHRVKEERNIVHAIKRRKANGVGHVWRRRCLLKHIIEGKVGRKDRSEG
jgi:hypothetical protein